MRKAIDGLSILVADRFQLDPLSGAYFVFCNRGRTILKLLYWERNGFCLWQKRLERERFRWPETPDDVLRIQGRELAWLLDGLDFRTTRGHQTVNFSQVI